MNYVQLVTAIESYTANTNGFTADDLATFVRQAEIRVYNAVQLPVFRKTNSITTTVAGTSTITLPTDFKYMQSLSYYDSTAGETTFMYNKDVEYIRAAFPNPATQGPPTHYALTSPTTITVGPTPNASYTLSIQYGYWPESITTAGNSWLGDNFETVLLYGALVEAYTNMKGEADLLTKYQSQFESGMLLLKTLAEGKERTDTYRTPQPRYPVK